MRIPAREASVAMNAHSSGVYRRRLTDEHVLDIYLVSDRFDSSIALEVGKLSADTRLPDIELGDILDVTLNLDIGVLKIDLLVESFADVFYVLVDDLVDVTVKNQGAEAGGTALVQRLWRWEMLLEASRHGLSKSAQKGLFGELKVLESVIEEIGPSQAIAAWFGPEAGVRDFEMNNVGIEVKATSTRGSLSVKISSERQLELIAVNKLFLWCVSIENVADGIGLNQIVDRLQAAIAEDSVASELFHQKLMQVGYFEIDRNRYTNQYFVRNEYIFHITDKFPSIVSDNIDDCVCDVNYRIMLEGCMEWQIQKDELIRALKDE